MTSVRVRPQPRAAFNAVKVFSATTYQLRHMLGETVTQWLSQHPTFRVSDLVVTQSSDVRFHCLSICVFYRDVSDSSRSEHGAIR